MKKLGTSKDVWVLTPTAEDLKAGAYYAAVSLPWTFNRMMASTSSNGQQSRALRIAKGIVAQEMLMREMTRLGLNAQAQRKSHRDDDLFDLNVQMGGSLSKMDLKSNHYFTDYAQLGRDPFSSDLLLKHAGYAGADWRTFFPMLVPHTQIKQAKEAYCFAIASSIDIRKNIDTNRTAYALTAFPYADYLPFLSSKKLCLLREEANKGFFIDISYEANSLIVSDINLSIIGEWDGKLDVQRLTLKQGSTKRAGPFSCIASFQVDKTSYDRFSGTIEIKVKNEFSRTVLNTTKRNINQVPKETFILNSRDFCNLSIPTDYTLYVIGWTRKDDFLRDCQKYTGWVWPLDKADKFKNQAWNQITDADQRMLEAAGFGTSLQINPRLVKAGWLKTTGKGGGACCYVFPNIGANGGIRETNLYVLPQDLYTMDSLN